VFFSAATEPGSSGTPNEDWAGISTTAAVVLDGVTVFEGASGACRHGTPWFVSQIGTRLLASASDEAIPLKVALRSAITRVAYLHAGTCDLDQIGAPSAAVAVLRRTGGILEYLVLADVTIVIESSHGLKVISDERVNSTLSDIAIEGNYGDEVMRRRERNRNKTGGYWVAAADPEAAEEATTGQVAAENVTRTALMSDGATRLVTPFGRTDWPGILKLGYESGPYAVIRHVRETEASDRGRTKWPRFKVSDDATIALADFT
jgi:hypothetical protein